MTDPFVALAGGISSISAMATIEAILAIVPFLFSALMIFFTYKTATDIDIIK